MATFLALNPGSFYLASVRPNAQKVGALYAVSAAVDHDYVILSDFDTDLQHLEHLPAGLDVCDQDPDMMGCYFRMIPFEGSGAPFLFQQLEYAFARMYYKFHGSEQSVPVMPGAGSCFKRELLLQVYALHSGLRNGEDREATVIGLNLGFKTAYLNRVLALTRPPLTFRKLVSQRKRWYLGYIETVVKEAPFYGRMMSEGRRLGIRTIQDAVGVALLLLLPVEIILLTFISLKMTVLSTLSAYLLSVAYYSLLFWACPKERAEIKRKNVWAIAAYPLFWLSISFLAWWGALRSFSKKKSAPGESRQTMGRLRKEDVLAGCAALEG
jgi:cellulose synthase/poly-beta-1,6-N-acetylglucosamine synthase-like glycosyltransferase